MSIRRFEDGARARHGAGDVAAASALVVLALVSLAATARALVERKPLPRRLADTGLYSDFATHTVSSSNLPFTPQYPLWSDGAAKKRWIYLPPGKSIDAREVDAWKFPIGTKLWKEFSFGRRVETRYMELGADGEWLYATYVWSDDEREALLAPERGVRGACEITPGSKSGPRHDIPSVTDCRACHEGNPTQVLGFSALQLSPDRDPLAPHAEQPAEDALDLRELSERGLVRGLPKALAPRIDASTPRARAALGYLHANCGHCHNSRGPLAELGLALDYPLSGSRQAPALRTAVGAPSKFHLPNRPDDPRIAAGDPEHSLLSRRISSRNPLVQMPPLGTRVVDGEALALVSDWIRSDLAGAPHGAAMVLPTSVPDLVPERH